MGLSQLLEGPPDFLDKEMPVVTSSSINFYSESTIKREFDIVGKIKNGDKEYWTIINKDRSFAVIGELGTRKQDGAIGLYILGQLDFKDKPDFSSKRWVDAPEHVLQVDSVVVYVKSKFKGIGYDFYKAIVKYGFVLVSDHTQYRGGKALWQKIVKQALADGLEICVVADGEPILGDDGKPLAYDGKNIPDDVIWNAPTNDQSKSKYFTLLVLRNKK